MLKTLQQALVYNVYENEHAISQKIWLHSGFQKKITEL